MIISQRRGNRSASAPPSGLKNAIGTNAAAATVPVHAAWCVCSCTYVPSAIASIHVPMFDTNAPVHSRAYCECRNGANEISRTRRGARPRPRRRGLVTSRRIYVGHSGFRFSRNARDALVRVVDERVLDHHRAREAVRGPLVGALLLVERALAEREHRRARTGDARRRARPPRPRARRGARPGSRVPSRRRSAASIMSPVNSISSTRLRGIVRLIGTIGVEQNSPMFTPGVANRASSAAIARSHAATSWQPAAVATPWTLAITGCGIVWSRVINSTQAANSSS